MKQRFFIVVVLAVILTFTIYADTKGEGTHYSLIFNLHKQDGKIFKTIDGFFNQIISKQDSLSILTPKKGYHLKQEIIKNGSSQKLAAQLKGLLTRDIKEGNYKYWQWINDLEEAMRSNEDYAKIQYDQLASNFLTLRHTRLKTIINFLKTLHQSQKKAKIIIFYDMEYVPANPASQIQYSGLNIKDKDLKEIFTSPEFAVHFIYLSRPKPSKRGLSYDVASHDGFNLFESLTKITKGTSISTSNPDSALKSALKAE